MQCLTPPPVAAITGYGKNYRTERCRHRQKTKRLPSVCDQSARIKQKPYKKDDTDAKRMYGRNGFRALHPHYPEIAHVDKGNYPALHQTDDIKRSGGRQKNERQNRQQKQNRHHAAIDHKHRRRNFCRLVAQIVQSDCNARQRSIYRPHKHLCVIFSQISSHPYNFPFARLRFLQTGKRKRTLCRQYGA